MANLYIMTVRQILPDHVVVAGTLGDGQIQIVLRGDGIHTRFTGVGQYVDVHITLTPQINGVAQVAVTP